MMRRRCLQGFPPRDVLRTVYVEHDIDASEAMTPVVDFVYADRTLQGVPPPTCLRLHACVQEEAQKTESSLA